MWPFEKKSVCRTVPEGSGNVLEELGELKTKIRIVERELDEQHDFIRRLAARRAKEIPIASPTRSRGELLDDEPSSGRLTGKKAELWNRLRAKKNGEATQ